MGAPRLVVVVVACAGLGLAACVGTTGGDVVEFPAAAAGPRDANGRIELTNDRGWHVVLTRATLHVGAVYLSANQPVSGAQTTGCVLPGSYVAEVTTGADVDLLSAAPQRFPALGHGTTLAALVGQVWLTTGPVDDPSSEAPVLVIEGTADRAGDVRPFTGQVTIGKNRVAAGGGGAGGAAGSSTICKQRIVSPIPAPLTIRREGGLVLRVDPRALFVNVDFGALGASDSGSGFVFRDDPSVTDPDAPRFYSQPSVNLYQNLHAATGVYSFEWDDSLR
jgi:hypothetical protein